MRNYAAWIVSLSLLLSPGAAWAGQCVGVAMPDHVSVDGKPLLLNGLGLREATLLAIDVYVAGLYLERRSKDGKSIAASRELKQLRLTFVREVDPADMRDNMRLGFRRAAKASHAKLAARFELLESWIPKLSIGDTFSLTYRPATGLELRHGDKLLGTIAGDDFATAIFAIWLGDHPPGEALKAGLLGGRCG